jgi:hypothetical protein
MVHRTESSSSLHKWRFSIRCDSHFLLLIGMLLTLAIDSSNSGPPNDSNVVKISTNFSDHISLQFCEQLSTQSNQCDPFFSNCVSEVKVVRACRIMLWRLKFAGTNMNRNSASQSNHDLDAEIRDLEEELNKLRSERDRQKRNPGLSPVAASMTQITVMPRKVFRLIYAGCQKAET